MKKLSLLLVLTTLTVALSACSGDKEGGTADQSTDSSQITIGIPQDIEDSLDPHEVVAAGTKEVFFNIYEGLMKLDSDGNLIPAVASNYTVSDDKVEYSFTLRDNVKFHDGSTVTVEDVVYSIERCADTSDGTPLVAAFSNIESVTATDASTIVIQLVNPDVDFLTYMTTAIIPEANENPDTVAIGTGPYRFVSRSPQSNVVLTRFDEYWGTPAQIKDVTFKIIADTDMIVMNLKSGAIDMFCRITASQANELAGSEYSVLEGTMNLVQALYLNNEAGPFADVRVRQALCYAIDRQEILDFTADGKGTIIGSSMFPAFGKYYLPELSDYYNQDIDKAKQLLTDAGYPDGFTFTITVPSNYQQHIDTAQVIVEQLKNINVTAEINLVEWNTWLSDVYAARNYEATVVGVDASTMTAGALLQRFTSSASNNFINFHSEAYDTAFDNAQATLLENEQINYCKECERILTEDAANVYIQDMANLVALNNKYDGFKFYPIYVIDLACLTMK